MKKLHLLVSCVLFVGCASVINHPITGEKVPVPNEFIDKIDFDLTVEYKNGSQGENKTGKLVSAMEEAGISLDVTSLEPLLATSDTELTLGDLSLTGYYPTYVTLSFKELDAGVITTSIKPTFGGYPSGTINKWILIDAKKILIQRMDKIFNPLGYKYLEEEPLTN